MIAIVCSELNNLLVKDYLDKKHGLVFAAEIEREGKRVVFPIDFDSTNADYSKAVIPDASYRSLSYFEQNGPTRNAQVNSMYTGYVSFICWMNTEKIDMNNPNISDMILKDLENAFKNMRGKVFTGDNGGKVHAVRVNYFHNRNNDILAKYTYDKKKSVIAPPYDIVKLDLEVDFSLTCPNIEITARSC